MNSTKNIKKNLIKKKKNFQEWNNVWEISIKKTPNKMNKSLLNFKNKSKSKYLN